MVPKTAEPKEGSVTARLPFDLIERLREIAVANDRTLSAEIRIAVRNYVRTEDVV